MSAALHSLSGVIYNDYIRPRKWFDHNDANANLMMRFIIFIMGTFCAMSGIIVERFESIFQMVTTVAGMCTGAVFGTFTIGMLYPWANSQVINLIQKLFQIKNHRILPFIQIKCLGCFVGDDHKHGIFVHNHCEFSKSKLKNLLRETANEY